MSDPMPPWLQELLDRRIDPLDDPATRTWLEQHPENLEAFAALRAQLQQIETANAAAPRPEATPRVRSRRVLRRPSVQVAAAACAITLVLLARWSMTPSLASSAAPPIPRPDFAAEQTFVRCRVVNDVGDQHQSVRTVVEHGRASDRRRIVFQTVRPPSPDMPLCQVTVATEEILSQ